MLNNINVIVRPKCEYGQKLDIISEYAIKIVFFLCEKNIRTVIVCFTVKKLISNLSSCY